MTSNNALGFRGIVQKHRSVMVKWKKKDANAMRIINMRKLNFKNVRFNCKTALH